jgi:tRNA pseudouridine38-40 synthase
MESSPATRIRLLLHYDGSAFFGWQLQARERTVQGELERVLSRLFSSPARVIGSGRTDRGVHATGQVAVVDAPSRWSAASLRRSLNSLLPPDVWVAEAAEAPARFHPRFDAVARSYEYRVGLAPHARSPFVARWCWPLVGVSALDVPIMQRAADRLVGDHSFLAFAKAGQEERGDRCVVTVARWEAWDATGLKFHVTANRFLHHMVRYLVGTLVAVGSGDRPGADVEALLAGEPGLTTSPPAPPEGLFLTRVDYPADAVAHDSSST